MATGVKGPAGDAPWLNCTKRGKGEPSSHLTTTHTFRDAALAQREHDDAREGGRAAKVREREEAGVSEEAPATAAVSTPALQGEWPCLPEPRAPEGGKPGLDCVATAEEGSNRMGCATTRVRVVHSLNNDPGATSCNDARKGNSAGVYDDSEASVGAAPARRAHNPARDTCTERGTSSTTHRGRGSPVAVSFAATSAV